MELTKFKWNTLFPFQPPLQRYVMHSFILCDSLFLSFKVPRLFFARKIDSGEELFDCVTSIWKKLKLKNVFSACRYAYVLSGSIQHLEEEVGMGTTCSSKPYCIFHEKLSRLHLNPEQKSWPLNLLNLVR